MDAYKHDKVVVVYEENTIPSYAATIAQTFNKNPTVQGSTIFYHDEQSKLVPMPIIPIPRYLA